MDDQLNWGGSNSNHFDHSLAGTKAVHLNLRFWPGLDTL